MATKLTDIMAQLPLERRAKIEARAQELILENMTLQNMRKARKLTQESMAELLGIRQDSVSRLEKRADLLLSTLRSYVKAMGGDLKLVAEFPDRPSVIISALGELEDEDSVLE
ncbi:MAG: XRE family transcriptional regulator [Aphanizomenon gracile PMC649.10]|uniref:helix-turn-helix domain-containing protein n=1 Tax=Aphanizomenonaceae TaxID=1892259 RepID=UPI001444DAAF|nr:MULTISPECIES: XRE family transcriptional regulator [Aphanizomenonaceae]MDB9308341.1 XRE family transcriptional regulator [Aphanizomenon sp. CS-733/32]MDM3853766.1 XRE family transcriptional regulator [Aphanizomenon gracile PMC649.10]MTJ47538.1 helix-turn-helix domain-containing protein [Dolichospermum sp. UHCC 0259]